MFVDLRRGACVDGPACSVNCDCEGGSFGWPLHHCLGGAQPTCVIVWSIFHCLAIHCIPPDSPSSLAVHKGWFPRGRSEGVSGNVGVYIVLRGCRLFH